MADLGAIGYGLTVKSTADQGDAVGTFSEIGDRKLFGTAYSITDNDRVVIGLEHFTELRATPVTKTFSGTVQESGVPKVGWVVRAFRRDNGVLQAETRSVSGGAFTITIPNASGEYTFVAYDDTGASPDFNALIFDRVVPA